MNCYCLTCSSVIFTIRFDWWWFFIVEFAFNYLLQLTFQLIGCISIAIVTTVMIFSNDVKHSLLVGIIVGLRHLTYVYVWNQIDLNITKKMLGLCLHIIFLSWLKRAGYFIFPFLYTHVRWSLISWVTIKNKYINRLIDWLREREKKHPNIDT